jgi:hypothetical protein
MISVNTAVLNYLSHMIYDYFILFLSIKVFYYNLVVMNFYHSVLEYVLPNYGTNIIDQVC